MYDLCQEIQRTWRTISWNILSREFSSTLIMWLASGSNSLLFADSMQATGWKQQFSRLLVRYATPWSILASKVDWRTTTSRFNLLLLPRWFRVITGFIASTSKRGDTTLKWIGSFLHSFLQAVGAIDLERLDWCVWSIDIRSRLVVLPQFTVPQLSYMGAMELSAFRVHKVIFPARCSPAMSGDIRIL